MGKRRTFIADSSEITPLNPNKQSDSFDECVEAFLRYVRAKGRSEYTLRYYRNSLRAVRKALVEQEYSTRLRRITSGVLTDGYVRYATEELELKKGAIQANLRACRSFFNWAVIKEIIEVSPMRDIVIGKAVNASIITFDNEHISKLFAQPNLSTFVGLRDFVIMGVMLETGVRLREITDIEVIDVRMEDSQILVHGKNGEDRLVPFQSKVKKMLRKYLRIRGKSDSSYLFITHDDGQMSRRAVQERIKKYGRMAGIAAVRCSPHTFRHTFAKMSVRNGANIFELQNIMGHKSLDMVRTYVNLFSPEVREAHKRFSPVERLDKL